MIFKYEMKKTFSQRAYWIALALMVLVLIGNELTPIFLGNFYPKMNTEKSLSGTVIDDTFLASIGEIEPDTNNPLVFFIKSATGSSDITGYTADELYSKRKEINNKLMKSDRIPDNVIAKWNELDSKNEEPFVYHYCGGFVSYMEIASFINFMILIVSGIGLSGIFADERRNNTDQLIFCTKAGKRGLFGIKVLTGMILGIFTAAVLILTEFILITILFGWSGAGNMIQLILPQCMMHLDMGEAAMVMTAFFFLEALVLSAIAMAISQITMNHVVTMASMIFVMFLAMLNISSKLGVLYILWNSIPGAAVGSWFFTDYHMIEFFGHPVMNFVYIPVLWIVTGVTMLFIARYSYNRYEVKAR